jgi:hypothetical protein
MLLKFKQKRAAGNIPHIALTLDDQIPIRWKRRICDRIADRLATYTKCSRQGISPDRRAYFLNCTHSTSSNTQIMYRKGSFLSNIHIFCIQRYLLL